MLSYSGQAKRMVFLFILFILSCEIGSCFTETKNLDGETNLKPKFVDRALLNYFKDENDV